MTANELLENCLSPPERLRLKANINLNPRHNKFHFDYDDNLEFCEVRRIIDQSMNWSSTVEGSNYWSNINQRVRAGVRYECE